MQGSRKTPGFSLHDFGYKEGQECSLYWLKEDWIVATILSLRRSIDRKKEPRFRNFQMRFSSIVVTTSWLEQVQKLLWNQGGGKQMNISMGMFRLDFDWKNGLNSILKTYSIWEGSAFMFKLNHHGLDLLEIKSNLLEKSDRPYFGG